MIVNRIIEIILVPITLLLVPIQILTTFLLGLLVSLTLGLLLIPISLIWATIFLFPLVGLSYLYEKIRFARPIIVIPGIPLAITASIFASLMPSMGEQKAKTIKLVFANIFPFTWHCYLYSKGNIIVEQTRCFNSMQRLLKQYSFTSGKAWKESVMTLQANYEMINNRR